MGRSTVLSSRTSYGEDSRAEVDFNIVMNEFGDFVECRAPLRGTPTPGRNCSS